jgi:hypothetical protein
MSHRHVFLSVALAAALAAPAAHADPPRVGVELGQTLVGYRGLGLRLDLGPVQLEGLARWRDGWVGVAAGGDREHFPQSVDLAARIWTAEAGAHVEWFALPSLSLGVDAGATYGEQAAPSTPSVTHADIAVAAGGSLTFWF